MSRLGGGIGTRGPGETKLETDRRRIRTRIHHIGKAIDEVRRRRAQLRERRQKQAMPTVALVGYTNAGKTTLFNLLTRESAKPPTRCLSRWTRWCAGCVFPIGRELLVSDTVGFIDRLPHTLVAAFRATLEEVAEADLVLHVIDAASPERERHMAAVRSVLTEVDAADVPRVNVYNKCDLLGPDELRRLQASDQQALFISARTGAGRDESARGNRRAALARRAARDAGVRSPVGHRPRAGGATLPRCARDSAYRDRQSPRD